MQTLGNIPRWGPFCGPGYLRAFHPEKEAAREVWLMPGRPEPGTAGAAKILLALKLSPVSNCPRKTPFSKPQHI